MSSRNNGSVTFAQASPLALEIGRLGQSSLTHNTPVVRRNVHGLIGALLDKVMSEFEQTPGAAGPGMLELQSELASVRETSTPEVWADVARMCDAHPVAAMIRQDPFTEHCYRKPRGYAGDAQLLDYLYGISDAPEGTTPLGRSIFNHMMAQQGALSVRSRGKILAHIIDETAERCRAPRILSIACGHLREAAHSQALMNGRIREFIALDQDADSLARVGRVYAGTGVQTVNASVKSILAEKVHFERFDLVYAAGLYDYLSERVAARLTRLMFDMVAPGGRVLVANFAPTLPEVGYMETFMDWKLIYRTAEEMALLTAEISGDEWKSNRLFWDEPENIVFLDLVKRTSNRPITTFSAAGPDIRFTAHNRMRRLRGALERSSQLT